MTTRDYSIVEFHGEHERYRCGYCKSIDSNYSHGMWAHSMTVQDYQDLIDRGWRRSGCYCYKPTMHVTCCPMYTIKCAALDVKLSKSQKKVIKRFHRYLSHDDLKTTDGSIGEGSETSEAAGDHSEMIDIPDLHEKSLQAEKNSGNAKLSSVDPSIADRIGNILSTLTDTLSGTGQLIPGTGDLLSGAGQIISGTGELLSGAGQLLSSSGQLLAGTGQLLPSPGQLLAGTGQLLSSPGQLLAGTGQLLASPGQLLAGTGQFLSSPGQLLSSTGQLLTGSTSCDALEGKSEDSQKSFKEPRKIVAPGKGYDTLKPPCKKAKLVRLERKKEKLMKQGFTAEQVDKMVTETKKQTPSPKSLEEFLAEAFPENPVHKLEIRLVRSSPPSKEFEKTSKEAHEVYQKYQYAIHGESPEKCSYRQYIRFLVSSPLQIILVNVASKEFMKTVSESHQLYSKYQVSVHKETPEECNLQTFCEFLVDSTLQSWKPIGGPPEGYGSFHQQYWLDGRLIAVGVLDILPRCVSSVYFYYDPEMGPLSLGTYASLQELSLVRALNQHSSDLKYYYMGFYIHTCPKMRYKAAYSPSYLLCPETYTWHPVTECKQKLDQNRYCRFEENDSVVDSDADVVVNNVLVLYQRRAMPYSIFRALNRDPTDVDETSQYAQLVGMKCARRMLLVKN